MASSTSSSSSSLFCLLFFLLTAAASAADFDLGCERRTHLRFYFHEIFRGANATTVMVTQLNNANTFGDVDIFDAVLREGPSKSSREIGRAQGVNFHVSQRDEASLTEMELVFTRGEFCDSSLTVVGRLGASGRADRAVVGGTGQFQLARGRVVSRLVTSSADALVAVFDAYVIHYDDDDEPYRSTNA